MQFAKATVAQNKTDSSYIGNVSSRTSVSCFISQVKFQVPAPCANKQCIFVYKQQHVYFVTSNDSGLIRPLGLIKISCNIHVRP